MSLQKLFIYQNFNDVIDNDIFPKLLRNAIVSSEFKKGANDRPASILPNISKIWKICLRWKMYLQTHVIFFFFFDEILSKYQSGFRKGFHPQHCVASMVEKWCKAIDSGGCFGAFLTDLSKGFDCLLHELLIAKLHAYRFVMKSL